MVPDMAVSLDRAWMRLLPRATMLEMESIVLFGGLGCWGRVEGREIRQCLNIVGGIDDEQRIWLQKYPILEREKGMEAIVVVSHCPYSISRAGDIPFLMLCRGGSVLFSH